jgi:NAD(P)-dependent dehydrogenase (short-subunit alcohol dehydrogenase family)
VPDRTAVHRTCAHPAGRKGGLGVAIAQRLAAEGAAFVLSDIAVAIDPATAAVNPEYRGELAAGADVSTCVCDVRDWGEVRVLAGHAVAAHGTLDI